MDRATKKRPARRRDDIDRLFQPLQGRSPNRGIRRNRVICIRTDGHGCPFQADLIELLSQLGEFRDIQIKHGKFDAVVSPVFEVLENPVMLFSHVGRPEQHVHTVLHDYHSPTGCRITETKNTPVAKGR